ncbi:diaminopimelate decarboxylase [Actinophytocola xinjiangensis]|uniref:Diaminopimelate decarboxylase n=2 Tax=Actinophytocola xinjiangensis TaxID=485602 RepID=A0A7Z0WM71_9PSEU|nr:diaminopimelate decarboxylase [Actinophytocola xinjiangensis]
MMTGSRPDWLRVPPDLNALAPRLWPRSARRDPDGVVSVGGVAVTEVAHRFATPAYLFDEAEFLARCAEFRAAFHDFDIFYAGKSFLCKAVARLVAGAGLNLDVCTGGELAVALAAGFPAERIVMHGNNKSAAELDRALRAGVGRIVVDSFDEITLLTELALAAGVRQTVLVRATVGVRADTHSHIATAHDDQKFGLSVTSGAAAEAVRRILAAGVLDLAGLHTHIGSQIFGTGEFAEAAHRAVALHAEIAHEHGVALPELSLGGGFGIAYVAPHDPVPPGVLAERLRTLVAKECAELGVAPPRLAIEPGRAISGPSGVTLYRVGVLKHLPGLRTYVGVDGGMSDNIRPPLYGGVYTAALGNRTSTAGPMLSRVVGKHCDAGDIVVPDEYLPADLAVGDLLVVPNTGAYCRSLSNNFNHVPRPPVLAVADGQVRVIIRGETEDDLLRLDVG